MQIINTIFGYPLGWIMWLCYKVIPIYGVALIVFTIIMRAILIPFSIKQQKSMVKMQIFQPKMQEIQKKYANNREKMNEEMMKLYQEENYNPMSGCLPMVIQFPVLFGLIDVIYRPMTHILRFGSEIVNQAATIAAPLLNVAADTFTKDYSSQLKIIGAVQQNPDAFSGIPGFVEAVNTLNLNFLGIDLTQTPSVSQFNILWIIPILSGLTSVLMTIFTMKQTAAASAGNSSAAGMSKGMMLMMPLMSVWFAFILPAGVGIYWIISNVLMAIQTFLLNKFMNPVKLAEQAREEMEIKREEARQAKIEAKKQAREEAKARGENPEDIEKALSQKEINRIKLAEARRRMAEKYGDSYTDVTDEDLK